MKLNEDVLLEIVDIVRTGILEGKDISDMLRDLDLQEDKPDSDGLVKTLSLSDSYKERRRKE